MPRHTRGEPEPQRPPAPLGTQSRSDRGRAVGREPAPDDDAREGSQRHDFTTTSAARTKRSGVRRRARR